MSKFALKEIRSIRGKQQIYDLVIDGTGQIEAFELDLEKRFKKQLFTIYSYLELVANGHSLPKEKFRDITPDKEAVKEYEMKSSSGLRIYLIKTLNGKIIAYCGFKNSQDADVRQFRSIKKQYLSSLQNK